MGKKKKKMLLEHTAATMATAAVHQPRSSKTESYVDNKRKDDVCQVNIVAARTVADAVRTSLGPKGVDKMISAASSGEVIITKDGATILNNKMEVLQLAAKMLVELSKSQDILAFLKQCLILFNNGIHPTAVSEYLHKVADQKAVEVLTAMDVPPVELSDHERRSV